MPIRIAHISDPHFGAGSQPHVWNVVAAHLAALSPQYLLVTGDIADSPGFDILKRAHRDLDSLHIPYRVVPGNHDRFAKGNRILRKLISGRHLDLSGFDREFDGRLARPDAPATETLRAGSYQRTLRIIGMDSSRNTDFFARGYVDPKDMEAASGVIRGGEGSDLTIALVHHHLLAVRALEEARWDQLSSLAAVTTLVNAGSVLESFSRSGVSMVLHGHEHAFNCAWYGSINPEGGAICVIGAPSVTGNDPLKGCSLDRAGYNLIELTEDGNVRLEARRWTGGSFDAQFSSCIFGCPVPRVERAFSNDEMLKRLSRSTSVRMLVMRSEGFFLGQASSLREWIEKRGLTVDVLLPDPNNAVLMEQLCTIYKEDARGLASSIAKVVNILRNEIHLQISDRSRLSVSFHQSYPVYSAYLFDDEELWYFPYHYRPNSPDKAPVYVYPHSRELSICKDFKAIPALRVDLDRPFALRPSAAEGA